MNTRRSRSTRNARRNWRGPTNALACGEESRVVRLLGAAMIMTLIAFCWFGYVAYESHHYLVEVLPKFERIEELKGDVRYYDEALTMSALMAASTGDLAWEERYRSLDRELSAALMELGRLAPDASSLYAASKTVAANEVLTKMELGSFALDKQGQRSEAMALLTSDRYTETKAAYSAGMSDLGRALTRISRSESDRQYSQMSLCLVSIVLIDASVGRNLVVYCPCGAPVAVHDRGQNRSARNHQPGALHGQGTCRGGKQGEERFPFSDEPRASHSDELGVGIWALSGRLEALRRAAARP